MGSNVTVGPLITVTPELLTQRAFASFGAILKSQTSSSSAHNARKVGDSSNSIDGTSSYVSIREEDPSKLVSLYAAASNKKSAQPRVSTIACVPAQSTTTVYSLKRHLYTSLSIVPLNSSAVSQNMANLVIIAPSLPVSPESGSDRAKLSAADGDKGRNSRERSSNRKKRSRFDVFARARPAPFLNDFDPPRSSSVSSSVTEAVTTKVPISLSTEKKLVRENSGEPDLSRIRAFQIQDDQSIMLSPGTWYTLIMANSVNEDNENKPAIPAFAVMRYCNGIEQEDENFFNVTSGETGRGPVVKIEMDERLTKPMQSKL